MCRDVETYLAVALSTALAETFAAFSSSRHVDGCVCWWSGWGEELVVIVDEEEIGIDALRVCGICIKLGLQADNLGAIA